MISDEKLRKREHILKTGDFAAIYRRGRSCRRGALVLSTAKNGLGYSRIGFSISSTNVRSAPVRNRIRRVFREAYRLNKQLIVPGVDMVIIARRPPAKTFGFDEARRQLLELGREAGILT